MMIIATVAHCCCFYCWLFLLLLLIINSIADLGRWSWGTWRVSED